MATETVGAGAGGVGGVGGAGGVGAGGATPSRQLLRTMVRGGYDIQKLRIQCGNRILANYKAKLGQAPGKPEDELSEEAKELLKNLRAAYARLADAVVNTPRFKAQDFKGDEVISNYTEFCLIAQYIELDTYEKKHFKRLEDILMEFPIYSRWLADIRGIGPAMAGVLVSEIDIHRSKYASSLWKLAGLDVVQHWAIKAIEPVDRKSVTDEMLELIPISIQLPKPGEAEKPWEGETGREVVENGDKMRVTFERDGEKCTAIYRWIMGEGRTKQKKHLIEREYLDHEGKPQRRDSITYNPFLKTKLVGVLATCFLRTAGCPYAVTYRNYKTRLEQHAKWGAQNDGKKEGGRFITWPGRRHKMAMRYMTKMFLVDLYKKWRALEGLPVHAPYSEAKLGMPPHGEDK